MKKILILIVVTLLVACGTVENNHNENVPTVIPIDRSLKSNINNLPNEINIENTKYVINITKNVLLKIVIYVELL